MHLFSYPATFRRDAKGRIVVGLPDLPEAHTDGRETAEAIEEAVDCLGSVLAFRIAETIQNSCAIAGKLALYLTMIEQGVTNSELARRIGVRETVVRRMLDPDLAEEAGPGVRLRTRASAPRRGKLYFWVRRPGSWQERQV